MAGQSLDDEIRESLLQLLELAEQQRGADRLSEAERVYREVLSTAEQAHLPDLVERGQRALSQLLSVQRLAQADAALRDCNLADAEALYRDICETLAPGDAAAVAGLAQTSFLLGQQAEADERPMAAREYYLEALRLDPQFAQAQARLMAVLAPQRQRFSAKLLGVLIASIFALVVGAALWMRPSFDVVRSTSFTPATRSVAQDVSTPTSASTGSPSMLPTDIVPPTSTAIPQAMSAAPAGHPTVTPTEVVRSTITAVPPMISPPIPSATTAPARRPDLTFAGRVQQPDGRPLDGFRYVQLWGATGPDIGDELVHKVATSSDGSFLLRTTGVYNYYFVSLDTDTLEAYGFLAAAPGRGGVWRGPREIRYQNLAEGVYDGILFTVRIISPPTIPQLSPAPTVTAAPVLPVLTLQEPPADFTSHGSAQFRWTADGALPEGVFFEVVMWQEGQNPRDAQGVVRITRETWTDVNFEAVPNFQEGAYHWDVILVRTMPAYARLSQPGTGRRIYVDR